MGAFVKTTKVCAVAALGIGLSLGIAVSADPSIASAAEAAQAEATPVVVTSPTEIDADEPFDIAGTAKPGATVSIFGLQDGFEVSVPVDADGNFQYRTTRGLRAGVRPVEFYVGLERTTVEYRVRSADGTVPVLRPLQVDAPSYVPGQRLTLTGSATPGAKIDVRAYTANISGSDVTVGADGTWSFTTPRAVTGLEHEVTVRQTAAIGSGSVKLTVTGDESSFAPLVVDVPSYVPGQTLTLTGSGTAGAEIDVRAYSAGIYGSKVRVGADGKWSFTSPSVVTGLSHEVKVYQQNGLGTQTKTLTVTGDESSFAPLVVDVPSYVPGQTLTLTGSGTAGAEIDVRAYSAGIYGSKVRVGADGKWSFTSPSVVTGLSHEVRVYQQNGLGTQTKTLQAEALDENGDRPEFRALAITSDTVYVPGGTTRLAGKATSWTQVRVTLSNPGGKRIPGAGSAQYTVLAGADGSWSVDIPSHTLIHAKVQQHGERGSDSIEFDFDKA